MSLSRGVWLLAAAGGVAALGILAGGAVVVLPTDAAIKLAVLLVGALVLVTGLIAGRSISVADAGETKALRVVLMGWLFLLGACPAYLPFKLGPLPGLNPQRIAFLLLVGLWCYQLVASSRLRQRLQGRIAASPWLFGLFAAYLVWQLLSAALAEDFAYALNGWLRSLAPPLVALVVLTAASDWRDALRMVSSLCAGALVACAVGLLEWTQASNPFLPFFPTDPEQLAALQWIAVDKSRGGAYRVASTFSHPLALGEFLSMCLPLAGALLLAGQGRLQKLIGFALMVGALPVIYLTHTRSALLAAAVSVLLFGALVAVRAAHNRRRPGVALLGWMTIVVAIVGGVAVAGSALELAQGRDADERGSSLARVEMFNRAVDAVIQKPLQGHGPGTAAMKAGVYAGPLLTIDSHYLSVVVEHGLVGLLVYLAALTTTWCVVARAGLTPNAPARWLLPAVVVAVTSSLTMKIALSLGNNFELLYALIALGVLGSQWDTEDPAPARAHPATTA